MVAISNALVQKKISFLKLKKQQAAKIYNCNPQLKLCLRIEFFLWLPWEQNLCLKFFEQFLKDKKPENQEIIIYVHLFNKKSQIIYFCMIFF